MENCFRSFYFQRKNYPEIRQQNQVYHEKYSRLNEYINERAEEKQKLLINLKHAVALVTETLKVRLI